MPSGCPSFMPSGYLCPLGIYALWVRLRTSALRHRQQSPRFALWHPPWEGRLAPIFATSHPPPHRPEAGLLQQHTPCNGSHNTTGPCETLWEGAFMPSGCSPFMPSGYDSRCGIPRGRGASPRFSQPRTLHPIAPRRGSHNSTLDSPLQAFCGRGPCPLCPLGIYALWVRLRTSALRHRQQSPRGRGSHNNSLLVQ